MPYFKCYQITCTNSNTFKFFKTFFFCTYTPSTSLHIMLFSHFSIVPRILQIFLPPFHVMNQANCLSGIQDVFRFLGHPRSAIPLVLCHEQQPEITDCQPVTTKFPSAVRISQTDIIGIVCTIKHVLNSSFN